jgi:hypothetical protein
LPPLDIKGGVEALPKEQQHNNINCHEQYKNTRCRAIILREA